MFNRRLSQKKLRAQFRSCVQNLGLKLFFSGLCVQPAIKLRFTEDRVNMPVQVSATRGMFEQFKDVGTPF